VIPVQDTPAGVWSSSLSCRAPLCGDMGEGFVSIKIRRTVLRAYGPGGRRMCLSPTMSIGRHVHLQHNEQRYSGPEPPCIGLLA
jgi:hypothetical protein